MSDRTPALDFDEEAEAAEAAAYEHLRDNLQNLVTDFADDNEISTEYLSMLLIDLGVLSRLVHYATTVDKPSVAGLKLDLDRLRREIDEMLRDSKRGADTFLAASKQALAEADKDPEGS